MLEGAGGASKVVRSSPPVLLPLQALVYTTLSTPKVLKAITAKHARDLRLQQVGTLGSGDESSGVGEAVAHVPQAPLDGGLDDLHQVSLLFSCIFCRLGMRSRFQRSGRRRTGSS